MTVPVSRRVFFHMVPYLSFKSPFILILGVRQLSLLKSYYVGNVMLTPWKRKNGSLQNLLSS